MSNFNEEDQELIKNILAIMKALERTMIQSDFKEDYLKNKEYWTKALNVKFGEIHLKNIFDKPHKPEGAPGEP